MSRIDRIKAELKRRIKVERINKANGYPECDGAIVAYQGMLDFVNSLSYKTENDDEFEAYFEIYNKEYSKGEYCHETSFKWGFEEGSRWKEKSMMQNAVIGILDCDDNGSWIELESNIVSPSEAGDKVKVTITKE
jgi:hypothetical protein